MDNKPKKRYATAPRPTTTAAIARPVSKVLTIRRAGATPAGAAGRAAGAGAASGRCGGGAVAGRGAGACVVAAAGGVEGRGAAIVGADGAGAGTPVGAGPADAGPPGGKEGNLMVAVGLGGKLMRTVSFLGWTLAASAGLGGTPPGGGVGLFSAIKNSVCDFKLELAFAGVKLLF